MRGVRLCATAADMASLWAFLSRWFGGKTRLGDIYPKEFEYACQLIKMSRMPDLQITVH